MRHYIENVAHLSFQNRKEHGKVEKERISFGAEDFTAKLDRSSVLDLFIAHTTRSTGQIAERVCEDGYPYYEFYIAFTSHIRRILGKSYSKMSKLARVRTQSAAASHSHCSRQPVPALFSLVHLPEIPMFQVSMFRIYTLTFRHCSSIIFSRLRNSRGTTLAKSL